MSHIRGVNFESPIMIQVFADQSGAQPSIPAFTAQRYLRRHRIRLPDCG